MPIVFKLVGLATTKMVSRGRRTGPFCPDRCAAGVLNTAGSHPLLGALDLPDLLQCPFRA